MKREMRKVLRMQRFGTVWTLKVQAHALRATLLGPKFHAADTRHGTVPR